VQSDNATELYLRARARVDPQFVLRLAQPRGRHDLRGGDQATNL
jgi:hypothetical protein